MSARRFKLAVKEMRFYEEPSLENSFFLSMELLDLRIFS